MVKVSAIDEIIDFIAGNEPTRILNFHPSDKSQERVELLLSKKQDNQLTATEERELEYFSMLEHIIRLAKAKALKSMAV